MKKRILSLALAVLAVLAVGAAGPRAQASVEKLIAITFDDGPSVYTEGLLDGLRERGVVASFFMAGVNGNSGVVNQPQVLSRMWEEGHQLGNHTYSHLIPFDGQSAATISSQASRVEELLFQHVGGSYTDMVRTPGGAVNSTVRNSIPAPLINWSVDTLDWKYRNEDTVYENILSDAHDGAIVLLHDLYPTSIRGALRAIDTLKGRGYSFVTVAELLRRRGIAPQNGSLYTNARPQGNDLPAYSAPSLSWQAGAAGVEVTLSSPDGLGLYYTTDGSYPNLSSPRYTGPITITADTAFTVVGIDAYGTRTPAARQTVAGMAPTAAPEALYEGGQLSLSCATPGAQIYYTADGSLPNQGNALYAGPFSPGQVTKCFAQAPGHLASQVVTCALTAYGHLFLDVEPGDWFYPAVGEAVHAGAMGGMGEYLFSPDTALTRAQAVQALYNLEGRPPAQAPAPFGDTQGHWAGDAIAWAVEQGVAAGYPGDLFLPEEPISRQEFAVMLYHCARRHRAPALGAGSLESFPDGEATAPWAREAMAWAVGTGLFSGNTDGTLAPTDTTLRSQAAAVLTKYAGA